MAIRIEPGLLVLSGCRKGELAQLMEAGQRQRAIEVARAYRDVFGPERFYVELQHHDVHGDSERLAALAGLAEEAGLELVATNNAHYHVRNRHRLNDVLVAVRHRLTLDGSHRERRPNSEFFLKSANAMRRRFALYPRAISNTEVIAHRCQFDLARDLPYRLPDYPAPEGATLDGFLQGICERAFKRKYTPLEPAAFADARERLDRELSLIAKHGLAGFFLIYWDILQMVNEIAQELRGRDPALASDERPVGRGRGSSVSSIVCYLIGLSHIDPVKNHLYLERFLNDELHSLPDIDIDFPRDIRDEILQRIYDRYGDEHAALVAAFPTYRFRSAVQDLGKVLGLPAPVLAKLNKLGGHYSDATDVAGEMDRIPELRSLVNAPIWRDLVDLATQVAGFPRHIGQHVGGVVISAEKLSSVVPVEPARMDGRFVCQWDKDSVDDARFVKIDFLALGMLSAVDDCLDILEETRGIRVDLGRIPHDSPEIYASICEGDTMGIFQIESRAQVQTLPRTRPKNIDASNAGAWPELGDIRLGLQHVKGINGGWQAKRSAPWTVTLPERIVAERRANGPYQTLHELITRARLSREQAEVLIRAGALDGFWLDRREMLWQLGLTIPTEATGRQSTRARGIQASLPLSTDQDMAVLPPLSAWQELAWDFERMGLSPGKHPMTLIRPLLNEGLITSLHLGGVHNSNRLPQGMAVQLAGMVVTRQRPSTASGVMFMLLEDEFGLANIVVYNPLQERQRELVRATPFIIVQGRVNNEKSGLPNIIAERFLPCPMPGLLDAPEGHNFS